MKSIKPGRGPSMMSGVSSIFVAIFGVIWTILAASIGGGLFALFGLVFIAMAVVSAVYNFKNATSKDRYSVFDITEGHEESDPLQERYGRTQYYDTNMNAYTNPDTDTESAYCPYCGNKVEEEFAFCNKCGKQLP